MDKLLQFSVDSVIRGKSLQRGFNRNDNRNGLCFALVCVNTDVGYDRGSTVERFQLQQSQ